MGNEPSDTHPQARASEPPSVRRWIDRALVGAIAAIVTLGGIVYGLTTNSLASGINHVDKRVDGVEKRTEALETVEKERGERLRAVEEQRAGDRDRLQRIEKSVDNLDTKLEIQNRDIQEILKRLPNHK